MTIAQTTSDETATTNDDYITDNFVGHNSLKAWKIEHDKQVALEKSAKDKKKPKSPKGNRKSKSPVGDTAKTPVKGSKKNTTKSPRPSSSSSQKQRSPSTSRANTPSKGTKSPKRGNSPKNKVKIPNILYISSQFLPLTFYRRVREAIQRLKLRNHHKKNKKTLKRLTIR